MKMETQFTKGEWKINDMPLPSRKTVEIRCDGEVVAELKHEKRAKHYSIKDLPELEANAKLIAAAPELLNALILASNELENILYSEFAKHSSDELEIAKSAIKKATT